MKLEEAFKQVEKFYQAIKSIHSELTYEKLKTCETPFKKWFRKEVPAPGYSKKSGVYIFSNIEEEILYIGKAASDNFGAEIYGKFGTASEVENENGPRFDNSPMAEWAPEEYKGIFKAGDIYISALNIMPKDFSSLFEVYLHVWCSENGGLPPINKRIG
ncbi:MAG: hypothetical protein KKC46_04335 [Proteobacteria bacterium]|nr:hypothetical protein [Pseudomonadota bacterium]